jgi:Terminase large subunit, T4likevirus-type, N-terminal
MPRKPRPETNNERPAYMDENGVIDINKIFRLQEHQTELMRWRVREGGKHPYFVPIAKQCLSVGGFRSGKTVGWLMFFVLYYCLSYRNCDILVLRRTYTELEKGAITDFKTFVPKELYSYDTTKHIATFTNGSRVFFGHCENNKMRDIEQYLGSAFPAILIDECGQFSPEAWEMLSLRNLINPGCEPDKNGLLPEPVIVGCTNPLGPFYEYYRTKFVEREPWPKPENARQDSDGSWWTEEFGEWRCIYDPTMYAMQRTTVMQNLEYIKRQPGIIQQYNQLPKAKRDKILLGLDGPTDGQYFDCFDPSYHVINLREEPDTIIWQDFQPVWVGQDWGMGHANTVYFFTKALVKKSPSPDYRLKTICFMEIVSEGGKTYKELASIMQHRCLNNPMGRPFRPKAIYFSHEKFSRQMDVHSPADDYSRVLKTLGLPGVIPATQDRIGSASMMYNAFKNGDLYILDHCKNIIVAIPGLMRDPDKMDDVLKTNSKGDDCYDGFRYGFFGEMKEKNRPSIEAIKDHAKQLDPLARWFYLQKQMSKQVNENAPFVPPTVPLWMTRVER